MASLILFSFCVLVSGSASNVPAKQTHENLTQSVIDYTSIESVKKRCPELEDDYVKDLVAAYTAIHGPAASSGQGVSALDLLYAARRKPAAGQQTRKVKKSKKQGKKKSKKTKKSKKGSKKQTITRNKAKQNKRRNTSRKRINKKKQTHGASNRISSKQDGAEAGKEPAKEADKEPEKDATCERLDALEPYVNLFLLLTQKSSEKAKDLEGSKKVDSALKKFIEHQLSP